MKVTIERAALLRAMGRAQGVVERRNTIPILANVALEAANAGEGGTLSMRATDLDIELVETLPASVAEGGGITVSAQLLHEIVRKLPDGAEVSLTLEPEQGRLDIRAGRSKFALATLPLSDFPVMASAEYACSFQAPAPAVARLFEKARFAVSTEETRYYLNGVYLHVAEASATGPLNGGGRTHSLRAVATDGHRLALVEMDLPEGAEEAPGVIVPRKTVGELRKILEDEEGDVGVSVSATKIRFETRMLRLTSKVIDGSFPDYTRVIPTANTRRMEVSAADFAKAVDRVATVSQERSRTVKLSLEEDRLTLSVIAPDSGTASEEIEVAYPDEALEIGFNARYLLEISSQIDKENAVFLFADSGAPTLVREGDDLSAVYVVMPMRV